MNLYSIKFYINNKEKEEYINSKNIELARKQIKNKYANAKRIKIKRLYYKTLNYYLRIERGF